jgi:hypothetical protein
MSVARSYWRTYWKTAQLDGCSFHLAFARAQPDASVRASNLAIARGGSAVNSVSLGPVVPTRRELSSVNRMVALVLAVIWLCAGIGAIVVGFMQARWLVVVLGVFALWYALLWLRVVSRRRLLTWAELVVPWRTR